MRKRIIRTLNVLLALVLTVAGPTQAEPGGAGQLEGLSGRIFVVEATVVYSFDPALPAGTVFDNCYYFNEDGTWFDPLYPDFGIAVPGIWMQHADRPKIAYTATVADPSLAPGLLLIQNGVVTPGTGEGNQKLLAYTTVILDGIFPVIEVRSTGRAADECPFF